MESKVKRERSLNFTRDEIELLVSIVENKRNILESKKSDSVTWKEKEQAWKSVESEFNSLSGGFFHDARHLKLKFESLKKITRKKASTVRAELYKTSGGTNAAPSLTPIEERIKSMTQLSCEGGESIYDCDAITIDANSINKYVEEIYEDELIMCEDQGPTVNIECISNTEPDDAQVGGNKRKNCNEDQMLQAKKWSEWTPKALKSKKHAALSNPNKNNEEIEQKKLEKKIMEENQEHTRQMQQFEKEAMLLKIELLKMDIENRKNKL